jgi:NB-ARC domain/Rx N-terminal domain
MAEAVITSVASSVISSTINSLATLAWNEISFLHDVPTKVQLIKAKLRLIQSYLEDAENKPPTSHLTANWLREIKHVAYQAQDVIERIIWLQRRQNRARGFTKAFSRYFNIPRYLKSLHDIGAEIDRINSFIPGINIIEITNNLNNVNMGEVGSSSSSMTDQIEDPRRNSHIREEDEPIGFDSEIAEIVKELLDPENKQLSIVSISGMGGIGKSTLARKVSSHSQVKTHFDVNVWITISKQYNVLSLQKQILKAATSVTDEVLEKMTPEQVREKLADSLRERKYLILIDDIWTTESWDDINDPRNNINPENSIFPNVNNGSRIILTTRKLEVGKYPEIKTFVHELSLLDPEKSWDLLKKKAFPPHVIHMVTDFDRNQLEGLGPQLAKKCGGLPLALVVLGGYLSKHLDYQTWSRMVVTVDWNEAGNQINISQTLALSYHDLPNYLKPAFLYITVFPEDQIIKCTDLIKLWIAEGFVPPGQKYKLEQVARMYLDQLYERGLVQVVRKNRSHGQISRIRIHDVLRDWGIERAREEGFFCVTKDSDDQVNPSDAHIAYRLALHGNRDIEDVAISMPNLRTFLGFELPENNNNNNISLRGLNSLRVISFIQKSVWSTQKLQPKYLKKMVFLRYLCVGNCETVKFPSSIGQLSNLQTLDCRFTTIKSLPSSLWEISTLKHVFLSVIYCKWNGPKKGQGKNLQTLFIWEGIIPGTKFVSVGVDEVAIAIEEMEQIVHLHLFPFGHYLPMNILSKISGLDNLEVLKLKSAIFLMTRIPDDQIPPNLRKLVLDCSRLEEDPMLVLEKLPKLVVLELVINRALKDMHCSASGFPQLKYLKLRHFEQLEDWKVDVRAMPSLCHLELFECSNLKRFPQELMEHRQLQLVEMGRMDHLSQLDYSRLQDKGCKVTFNFKNMSGNWDPFFLPNTCFSISN